MALIATQADLGSVTELWRQPQNYARFLGQELGQVYRGTLVVAMPAGFGIASVGGAPEGRAGGGGHPPRAVDRHDHQRGPGDRRRPPGTASRPRAAVASPGSGSALGSVDLGSWLALAAGAVLIVLAWTASLRARGPGARPPGLRRAR